MRYFSYSVSACSFACSAVILPVPINISFSLNSKKPSSSFPCGQPHVLFIGIGTLYNQLCGSMTVNGVM
jgi:hypothetical protein